MNNRGNVIIKKDVILEKTSKMTLHFTYDEDLKLKELSELLDLANKAINDFNREKGISNKNILGKKYAARVMSVKEGSIKVDVILNIVSDVSIGLLVNFLFERLKTWGETRREKQERKTSEAQNEMITSKYPFNIIVNGGNVNVHIHNKM